MKTLNKKQIIILASTIAVAVIGVVVFFVITSKKAAADNGNGKYVIAIYSDASSKRFVLAEVDKDELMGEPSSKNKPKEELSEVDGVSYSSFVPKKEDAFFSKYVLNNDALVASYTKQSENADNGTYNLYLFLYENEYYLLETLNSLFGGGYAFCTCWGAYNPAYFDSPTLFYWPGSEDFFKEEDLTASWAFFDKYFWQVPVHSFDDLVEFYERIDETYYKIDKEKQEIYVKGIEELTGKVTEDYFVKLIVDDEGIQIVVL